MRRIWSQTKYGEKSEFLNKYCFEAISGALVYCITNQIFHGYVKILDGDTKAWQGLVPTVISVIII